LFITGLRTISAVIQAQTKRAYDRAELQGNYNKALAIELDQLAALFDGLRSAADRLSDSLLFTSIAFRMRGIKSDTVDFPNKLRSPHIVDHIPGCDEIITVSYPEGDNAFPHDRPIIYLLGVRQADYYGQLTADLRPALLTKFFVARPQDAKLTEIAGNMARLAQVMTAQGVDLNRPAMVIFFPHKPYYGQAGYEAAAGLRLKEDLLTVINKLQEPA
jgi:hypothetical protein